MLSPNADGDANLYVEDKDKSVLLVNYGLNPKHVLPAQSVVEEFIVTYNCSGVPTRAAKPGSRQTLTRQEEVNLYNVDPNSTLGAQQMTETWFINSDYLVVYSGSAAGAPVKYYLVNRYDRDGRYVYQLKNREHIMYNHRSLDLGALTIPFKYRFGYNKDGIQVQDDVIAGFNIGVYAGYKITRSSLINKKGTYSVRNLTSLRIGPFINLSSTTLDSVSTTAGFDPLQGQEKRNIAVVSPGIGLMLDIRGVQMGVYGGYDIGVGAEARLWNFQGRQWLGFGIGYKLTDLFGKKD